MFSTFDLCLLLYVIRLAGWLKHCNLSLSLACIKRFSLSLWTVLMLSTFDLCLLLYVIRLAGWLKHCNLSLSHTCLRVA